MLKIVGERTLVAMDEVPLFNILPATLLTLTVELV